jgi:hypothetical protein
MAEARQSIKERIFMFRKHLKYLSVIFLLVLTAGCIPMGGWPEIFSGSGDITTQTFPLQNFNRVVFTGGGKIEIIQGTENKLELQADREIVDKLIVKVEEGVLYLGFEPGLWSLRAVKDIQYTLMVQNLEAFKVEGGASIEAKDLTFKNLKFEIDGGGALTMSNLDLGEFTLIVNGGASATLSGKAESFACTINGAASITASKLQATQAQVSIVGAGTANVWASQALTARIVGTGSISYYGSPQLTQSIEGLGTIKRIGEK